ncbi:MAG: peptidoglycan DD-metalloendopeptidase family protein [Bacteroidales bacterium]|nr:peptidoglycan DD-metalloendopeptidase family protein [Bacteroidales bacterium]
MRKALHILFLTMLVCLPAYGQKTSMKKLESQRAQLEKDIALINRQLAQNSKNSSAAMNTLTLVRSKISAREKLIAGCDQTLRLLNDSISVCQGELNRLQARYDTLSLYYGRLIRGSYKNRDSRIWYMYVLSSDSMGQAFRRFGYLRSLSAQMSDQALKIRETSARLEVEKERLTTLRNEADEMRRKVVKERASLQDEEAEHSRLVSQLSKDRKKYQQQLQEKNRQKEALNRKIADLIRAQQEAAAKAAAGKGKAKGGKTAGKTTSTEIDTKLSGEFAANKGRLPWPVEGAVVERFGKHKHPVYTNVDLPQNNGVTLTVKRGAEAKAVFNGKVTQIVVLPGYNQCVLVSHGEYFTLYSKLKTVNVKAGDKVVTGQVVGTVDTIGGEDQFHFELWKGSTPQNPENWLRN